MAYKRFMQSSAHRTACRLVFYSCLTLVLGMIVYLDSASFMAWDLGGLKALQTLPSTFKDQSSIFISVIGGPFASAIVIAGLVMAFWRRGMKSQATIFLSVFALLTGFEIVSKVNLDHLRPGEEFRRQIDVSTFVKRIPDISIPSENSFPSGHTMRAVFLSCMLATLLWPRKRNSRILAVATIATYALWSAYTRVYTGVHWPSDVIGGLALGLMGWLAYVTASSYIRLDAARMRGQIQQKEEPALFNGAGSRL